MNRFGAFLIHLGISLVIFLGLAALVVLVWYPDFFFATDGGWQGIRIIVFVDLVLGPLLTLVVFNRSKPAAELRRDLSIIAVIQVSCLTAGTWVVYSERPLALVYVDGRFYSMSADDYRDVGVPVPDLSNLPGAMPKRVAVGLPADYAEQSEIRRRALARRIPLRAHADLYVPLSHDQLDPDQEGVSASDLMEVHPSELTAWLNEHGGAAGDFVFFPFATRYESRYLGVSSGTGEIVDMLNVDGLLDADGLRLSVDAEADTQ